MTTRNNYIDFLRFIGVFFIVLAHVNAPHTISQLRCFDVPLMIFISGLAFSGKHVSASWKEFYFPRIKRLIIPVYLFLTCFFLLLYILNIRPSFYEIADSYLLLNNGYVNYVWIIRIFLLIMIITPYLIRLNNNLSFQQFWIVLIVGMICNEFISTICAGLSSEWFLNRIIIETIPYSIGYSLVFISGLRLRNIEIAEEKMNRTILLILFTIGLLIYIYIHGTFISISPEYKYPPRFYYLIYGLLAVVLLWYYRQLLEKTWLANNGWILFVGRNTIWIYLWHIVTLLIVKNIATFWLLKWILSFAGAVLFFYLQYRIVKMIEKRYSYTFLKYLKG